MDNDGFFDRNLLALARKDPQLCTRLSSAVTTKGRYKFIASRSGLAIPAIVDSRGTAHPLHSMVNPQREAERLLDTIHEGGLLIILGLGGGFILEEALKRPGVQGILIIDFDIDGTAELLASIDYISILGDPRVELLVNPHKEDIINHILSRYHPALFGGFCMLPLRPRVDHAIESFSQATEAVHTAMELVSDDYSVQAYFGQRWFANTLRNMRRADQAQGPLAPVRKVAICAAGPSLDLSVKILRNIRGDRFVLSTDTALPALLSADLIPDAVISIDCQHISYYHFMHGIPEKIPLLLDLASPPVIAGLTRQTRFFSGTHPLTRYISRHWKPFPMIDTSGGNVSYAAVSLADTLGAELIELYGADFSYPHGASYARGTYIHPHFQFLQNRLSPLESLFTSFIFRNESLQRVNKDGNWGYETKPLSAYRERLEELIPKLHAKVYKIDGQGTPIQVGKGKMTRRSLPLFSSGRSSMGAWEFLESYRKSIIDLPTFQGSASTFLGDLKPNEQDVLTTLLPSAAAIRKRKPQLSSSEIFKMVSESCIAEIDRVLASPCS